MSIALKIVKEEDNDTSDEESMNNEARVKRLLVNNRQLTTNRFYRQLKKKW
jgi:hypothetical protein